MLFVHQILRQSGYDRFTDVWKTQGLWRNHQYNPSVQQNINNSQRPQPLISAPQPVTPVKSKRGISGSVKDIEEDLPALILHWSLIDLTIRPLCMSLALLLQHQVWSTVPYQDPDPSSGTLPPPRVVLQIRVHNQNSVSWTERLYFNMFYERSIIGEILLSNTPHTFIW